MGRRRRRPTDARAPQLAPVKKDGRLDWCLASQLAAVAALVLATLLVGALAVSELRRLEHASGAAASGREPARQREPAQRHRT